MIAAPVGFGTFILGGPPDKWMYYNRSQPASELMQQLLSELRKWQPALTSQQDDITLIVVDVL
jgi:serine phosphatase RsbU (regulator of sigma subunit)